MSLCYHFAEKIFLKGISVIVANDRSLEEVNPCYLVRNFPKIDMDVIGNARDMDDRLNHPLIFYADGVWKSRGTLHYLELAKRLLGRGYKFRMVIAGPCTQTLNSF